MMWMRRKRRDCEVVYCNECRGGNEIYAEAGTRRMECSVEYKAEAEKSTSVSNNCVACRIDVLIDDLGRRSRFAGRSRVVPLVLDRRMAQRRFPPRRGRLRARARGTAMPSRALVSALRSRS